VLVGLKYPKNNSRIIKHSSDYTTDCGDAKIVKNVKMISFVSITLAMILLFGQSYGVSAMVDQGSRGKLKTSTLYDSQDFSVDIGFVGYGSTTLDEITMNSDGTYHYITSDTGTLNLITLKTNITGYTCWGSCSDTSLATSDGQLTVGQLLLIVDGIVSNVGSGFMSPSGAAVGLIGAGSHVITIMYVGQDETDGLQYATDTIIVRVGTSETALGDYATVTAPFSSTVTDVAVAGHNITANVAYYDEGWSSWTQEDQFSPEADVTVDVGTTVDVGSLPVQTFFNFDKSIKFNGEINSSGFNGNQIDGTWDSTVGNVFVVDGVGVHPLSTTTSITLTNTLYSSNPEVISSTFVGLLVLADYGQFIKSTVDFPSWQAPFADFSGLNSVVNTTVVNATTGEIDGGSIAMDASFDFQATLDGTNIYVTTESNANTNTVTNTLTSTVTNTVNSTTTGSDETVTSVTTTNSPGFGAIISLLTIGVIAFAAPRLRREN
jgi:hypothetical protein